MLYKFLLFPARLLIHFYCRKVIINNESVLSRKGPLLIASNHPNSFLDAIMMAILFKHPVHSLARGDAFAGKFLSKILASLNMLPVYRISEGVENLESNYETFESCQNIFKNQGIVLIFSEGRCINEWHLRPLKKGTARLAITAWEQNIPLEVLPLGINYSSFKKFGKNIFLNFGSAITKEDMNEGFTSGKAVNEFNEKLNGQLKNLVFEIDKNDTDTLKKNFYVPQSFIKKILLFIPAIFGYIVHFPLYYSIYFFIKNKAADHFDSIMIGLLFFIYPVYVLAIALLAVLIFRSWYALLFLLILPFTAWSYLQIKKQI